MKLNSIPKIVIRIYVFSVLEQIEQGEYISGLITCEAIIDSPEYIMLEEEKWAIHHTKGLCHSKLSQTIIALKELITASKNKKIDKNEVLLNETGKTMEEIQLKVLNKMPHTQAKEFCQNILGINDLTKSTSINKIVFPVIKYFRPKRGQQSNVFNNINVITEKVIALQVEEKRK